VISILTGTVLETRIDSLVVNLGGAGLHVLCSPDTITTTQVGHTISLYTSLVVREESLTLFGFDTADNRDLFEVVQGVSGFGPKLAFTILATLPGDQLREAIANEDIARLTKTPGVGSKGAARLVLELKDRIGYTSNRNGHPIGAWQDQVTLGLTGLGWNSKDAARALTLLAQETQGEQLSTSELLRRALQILGTS
jgi:holliday junction DNA helicase RuvA